MNRFADFLILPISLLLYAILWYVLDPWLGYMLDSDGVAYLTIAKRVAHADYFKSINGLWSPLNGWLLVPFLHRGMDAWQTAKLLNAIFGGLVICLSYLLFLRLNLSILMRRLFALSLPFIVVYFVYFQMFGDVLQLVFVLAYLNVFFADGFYRSWWNPVLCGILMGIGFYAKAYSLIFFFLHFAVLLFLAYRRQMVEKTKAIQWFIIGGLTALIMVLPWSVALHQKYGGWSLTGHAGALNMSWNINSAKSFKPDIGLMIPPTYNDSPSFWEDPYMTQENLSGPISSSKHFVRWVGRVIHTCMVAVGCFSEISLFAGGIILFAYFYFYRRRKEEEKSADHIAEQLFMTILLLPLGYLMMHIETRYIWLNTFILMMLGMWMLQKYRNQFISEYLYKLNLLLVVVSFMLFPVSQYESLRFKNKDLFEVSGQLRKHSFKGKFSSNAIDAGRMWVIAYLTGTQFFTIERSDYTYDELLKEIDRYGINYFIYTSENNKPPLLLPQDRFELITKLDGMDVYQVKGE
ncbi:MAG: hypothetical protein JNJ58_06280 [Chitinophagaceae bacterium]|nr:hypothetical protein [Chitinophagaceae bacterium]